jgi:ornithine carbamoyltransferase
MKLTNGGNALYMHCFPADISKVSCEKGEVEEHVFERYRTLLYQEAGYKPYIIASLMFNYKFNNPAEVLEYFGKRKARRVKYKA